jgi:signal transduction histidine kinase
MNTSSNGFMVFCVADAGDGLNCVFSNDAAAKLTGLDHINGLSYSEVFGSLPDGSVTTGQSHTLTYRFPQSGCLCAVNNSSMLDGHFLCTITEIKEQKVSFYNQKLWQDAEEAMQFGGWILDIDTGHMEWTQGMCRLMGYLGNSISQSVDLDFFKTHILPDDLELFSRQMEGLRSYTDSYVLEFRIVGRDGEEKHLYLRGENVTDQSTGHLFSVSTIFNLSTLKLIQGELEQKVNDLNQSNADLEQFAYIASHDLQEPLRKIVTFGERLELKTKEMLNEEQHLYLDRILNSTRRMQEMINNLLEFSRVSSALKLYASTDLNEIMRSTLSDLEVTIQQKNAVVEVGELPVIEAVPAQMSQLFLNLISNSLKFTRPGVQPVVSINSFVVDPEEVAIRKFPPDREYVKVVCKDNGIGFDNNNAEKIFTIFQRLRGRSEFEGAGIGLAVCKKVVEGHHGTIEAFGIPDEGATFEIILPSVQH